MAVRDYWTPLATISEAEFDEYFEAVVETAEERLDTLERPATEFYRQDGYSPVGGMERNIYGNLLEESDDIESKKDLFNYAEEQINTETTLPGPLSILMRPVDKLVEGHRELVLQELFEEAKNEAEA